MGWFHQWRAARHLRNSSCREALAALPPGLEAYWRRSAPQEYQGIRTDAFFFVRAAEGLLQFFDVVNRSGLPCALPSEAADSVWHAWLRWDPAGLACFCSAHFGAAVPHVERAGLAAGALFNSYRFCRRREGITWKGSYLPALFRLDARLRMPGGHGYWQRSGRIVYAGLGPRGRRLGRALPHRELSSEVLYRAGLLHAPLRASQSGRPRMADNSGASPMDGVSLAFLGGDASGRACGDGDGGSAGDSGGGDGGSSCGSSCGSGCGGGGD